MHFLDTLCMFLGHVVHNCNITSILMTRWVAPINRGKNLKIKKNLKSSGNRSVRQPWCHILRDKIRLRKTWPCKRWKIILAWRQHIVKKKFQHLILIKIINELHNESFANFYFFFYFQRQDLKCIEWWKIKTADRMWRNVMPRKGRIRT